MALAVADIVNNATTNVATNTSGTKTFNLPTTSVEEGDLMVLCAGLNQATGNVGDILTATGWTKLQTDNTTSTTSTPRYTIFYREVPGGGLGSTVNVTSSDSTTALSHGGVAFAVQSANTTITDVAGTPSKGTVSPLSCPALTATNTGGLTIRLGMNDDNDQATQPAMTSHTSVNFIQNPNTVPNGWNIYVWAATQPSTSIAAATATILDDEWVGTTFVVDEASAVTITDVNTTETWDDGDTGLIITGTGFV